MFGDTRFEQGRNCDTLLTGTRSHLAAGPLSAVMGTAGSGT